MSCGGDGGTALNIVFDLGGVVVRWEPEKIITTLFTESDLQQVVRTEIFEHADWLELDRGTLDHELAIARGAERTGLSIARVTDLMRSLRESLVAIPATVDLLHRLKRQGHTLFCLSNMHVASIAHLESTYAFWHVFAGIVISCRLHLIKPEPAIYQHLLEKHGLTATETIFIDDMPVNLDAAAQFGIRPIRFEHPEQCERQLRAMGCL